MRQHFEYTATTGMNKFSEVAKFHLIEMSVQEFDLLTDTKKSNNHKIEKLETAKNYGPGRDSIWLNKKGK